MPHVRSSRRLTADRCGLLVIDLQAKLCPAISASESVIRQTRRLIEASNILGVPAAATVQYPQGLGPLVDGLVEFFPAPEEKLDFSAAVCRRALDEWCDAGRDQIVIVGIETHICVLQTVLDLIAEGLRPVVVADAVSSRNLVDHEIGLHRMRSEGATITTAESVMFEWLGTADRSEFKSVSKIVKT
ncbi:MAG: isochorismatase family protein [Rubripirellula sp.]